MVTFTNPFFSVAGQLERLSNVKNTLVAAVTGQGVKADTGNATVNKVLETAASHPFATAAVAATVINPTGALAAAKTVASSVGKSFAAAPLTTKAAVVVATPIVASAVIQSPKLQSAIVKAPSSLANFGTNVGKLAENPSIAGVKELVKENPILTTAVAAGAIAAIGGGIGLAANTLATFTNTSATKQNTLGTGEPTLANTQPTGVQMPTADLVPSKSLAPTPQTAPTANLVAQPQKSSSVATRKKRKSKRVSRPTGNNITKVLNIITNRSGVYG